MTSLWVELHGPITIIIIIIIYRFLERHKSLGYRGAGARLSSGISANSNENYRRENFEAFPNISRKFTTLTAVKVKGKGSV